MAQPGETATKDVIISPDKDEIAIELAKCALSPGYFIDNYLKIDDPNRPGAGWFPFKLWPAQRQALKIIKSENKTIILKARQLGLSWLSLGFALWLCIFKPGSIVLLFSRTSDDSKELIRRMTGMRVELPDWLRPEAKKELTEELIIIPQGSTRESSIKSFTTTPHSGRSYTASLVIIDEGAFIPFLGKLLNAANPTIDAGGKLILISTNDKEKPNNAFADTYRRAVKRKSDFTPIFIPWYARPSRSAEWYEHKKTTEKQDDLWQEYPEIPAQALAGLSERKRFAPEWIAACALPDDELTPYGRQGLPRIPQIKYYQQVALKREYLITIDAAEGDVGSDPTAIAVWDKLLWEEVAFVQGEFEPATTAGYAYQLAVAFNNAMICPERNNHGHAVILSLKDVYEYQWVYKNPFDKKDGWLTGPRTKTIAMDKTAELMELGELGIRSKVILAQLADIDAATQAAPEGSHDDAAMVAIIAAAALTWTSKRQKRQRRKRVASMSM